MTPSPSDRLASLDLHSLSPEHAGIVDALTSTSQPLSDHVLDLLPCGLQHTLHTGILRQSHRLDGARMHTVTYVLVPGVDPAALEAALIDAEWSWWKNGRISRWTRRADGSCSFVLSPVWPFVPSKVGIDMEPRASTEQSAPWGARIPITTYTTQFSGDFEGPGRYEILGLDGGSALRSVWDGVARLGIKKLMPLSMILKMHLGAEAGSLGFPLPKGTGFPGLVKRLTG